MLNVVSFEDANRIINEKFSYITGTDTVELKNAVGRIAAENILSREDIPAFNRSTVDGYALAAADTYGAGESIPSMLDIKGEILMGENASFSLKRGECAAVSTGGMLPDGADAVVMVENTDSESNELCYVFKAVSPFENVTKRGDDTREGEIVISKGTLINSRHIGVLAAMGYSTVPVVSKPDVAVISTGDELVEITEKPENGEIRNVNTHLLSAMIESAGGRPAAAATVHDRYDDVYSAVKEAAEKYDAVLISGGSSAGARDMTAGIISELGTVYAHGVAMKPGKPTILGEIGGKPVFGLPGHPAAAFFVTLTLVLPLIKKMCGAGIKDSVRLMPVKSSISSNHGREEFLCVGIEDGFAVPKYSKSGIISTLAEADGYIVIDRNTEGIKTGDVVEVHLFQGTL